MGAFSSKETDPTKCVEFWKQTLTRLHQASKDGKDDVHYGAHEGLGAELAQLQMRGGCDALVTKVGAALHDIGFKVKTGSAEEVVASIPDAKIPDPKGADPRRFNKDQTAQVSAMNKIIGAFEVLGGNPTKDRAGVHASAQELAKVVPMLTEGSIQEYGLLLENLRRVAKNLELLMKIQDRAYAKLEERIKGSDSTIAAETAPIRAAHDDIKAYAEKQLSLLRAMIKDAESEAPPANLEELKKRGHELGRLVKAIKVHQPDGKHGEMMAYVLSGLTNMATAAQTVQKALKTLGVKYAEYAKVKDAKSLDALLSEKSHDFFKADADFAAYIKASQVLYNHQYHHDEILKELDSKSGAAEKAGGALAVAPMYSDKSPNKLDKRVEARAVTRKGLQKTFEINLTSALDRFLLTGKAIAEGIGAGKVPLTDALEKFSRALDVLPNVQQQYIATALSGIDQTTNSRETRESYISSVKYLVSVIDEVVKDGGAHVSHFKDLKTCLDQVVKTINESVAKFDEGYSQVLPPLKAVDGAGEVAVGAGFAQLSKVGYSLQQLKETIVYYFRTAKIRQNLKKASGELASYQSGYIKVLADAVAGAVDEEIRAHKLQMSKLDVPSSWDNKYVRERPLIAEWFYKVDGANIVKKAEKDLAKPQQRLEALKELLNKQHDARIRMLRTGEAMDMYMMHFADGIAKTPDALQDVMQALEQTEIMSAWFTDKSGDVMCQVFELFPASAVSIKDDTKLGRVVDVRSAKLEEAIKGAEHYYQLMAAKMTVAADEVVAMTAAPNTKYMLPGNPLVGIDIVTAKERLIKRLEAAIGIGALKNMISAFLHIGDQFGGKLSEKAAMAPIDIYRNLMNYMVYSSFTIGQAKYEGVDKTFAQLGVRDFGFADAKVTAVGGSSYTGVGVRVGRVGTDQATAVAANAAAHAANPNVPLVPALPAPGAPPAEPHIELAYNQFYMINDVKEATVVMRSVNVTENELAGVDRFKVSDQMFELVMQAIPAKILTSIGVYNMFHRPVDSNALGYFSGLRLIMGGAVNTPKIVDENLPVYVRLPLLVEFYKIIFNFDVLDDNNARGDKFRKISMIPEIDGIFAGLIQLIFDKARYVKDGAYNDTDTRLMVEECNKICGRFKGKDMLNSIFGEFIAEMNRRYGIYTRSERVKYLEEKRSRYQDKYQDPEEVTDFELSGLDESSFPKPLPSQSYQTEGLGAAGKPLHKYRINIDENKAMIDELRTAIDNIFSKGQDNMSVEQGDNMDKINKTVTFDHLLRAKAEELKYAKTDAEKFAIVASAMNSLGRFATSALEKALIMFHETVVAPLNMLQFMYHNLKAFSDRVKMMSDSVDLVNSKYTSATLKAEYSAGNYAANTGIYGYAAAANVAIVKGTQGSPVDVTLANVLLRANEAVDDGKGGIASELIARFGIRQGDMFRDIIEALFVHSSAHDKLVSLRLEVAKKPGKNAKNKDTCAIAASLDHSKLYEEVNKLHNGVKMAIDRFRGLIPKVILDLYEKHNPTAPNPCALYTLEKEFIDTFLHGKKFDKDVTVNDSDSIVDPDSFERINERVGRVLGYLTKEWSISGCIDFTTPMDAAKYTMITSAAGLKADGTIDGAELYTCIQHEFTDVIGDMIWRSAYALGSGKLPDAAAVNTTVASNGIYKLLFNTSGKAKKGIADKQSWPDSFVASGLNVGVMPSAYDPVFGYKNDDIRGIVVSFNRLLAAYVNTVYDEPSRKVYITTLNKFANGAFNKAVMGDERFDDSAVTVTNIIGRGAANGAKGIIFRSLAQILKQLVSETTVTGDKKEFLEADLAEIPMYLKERMRANLPIFARQLEMIVKRADLLKIVVRAVNCQQQANLPLVVPAAPVAGLSAMSRDAAEQGYTSMLDEVIQAATSLAECVNDTLKDLADEPHYMETRQGFIADYEALNGQPAFMPLSSVMIALSARQYGADATKDENILLRPTTKLGENRFKWQYGTRGLLYVDDFKVESAPGIQVITKQHNQSCDAKHHFADKDLTSIFGTHLSLVKYLLDVRHHAHSLVTYRTTRVARAAVTAADETTHAAEDLVGPVAPQLPENFAVFSLSGVILQAVIRMTEANTQKEERLKIVRRLELANRPCELSGTREQMIAYNIIDLNVSPINLAALQRDMPFANLMNYGWTLGKLIADQFQLPPNMHVYDANREFAADEFNPQTAKHLLVRLLMNPNEQISMDKYQMLVGQIIRGDLGVEGLGQPKYLGQELWNKALFGEIISGEVYHEEVGVAEANAHKRGKVEVLGEQEMELQVDKPTKAAMYAAILKYILAEGNDNAFLLAVNKADVSVDAKLATLASACVELVAKAPADWIVALATATSDVRKAADAVDAGVNNRKIILFTALYIVAVGEKAPDVWVIPGVPGRVITNADIANAFGVIKDSILALADDWKTWRAGAAVTARIAGAPAWAPQVTTPVQAAFAAANLPARDGVYTDLGVAPYDVNLIAKLATLKGKFVPDIRGNQKARTAMRGANPRYFPKELHFLAANRSKDNDKKLLSATSNLEKVDVKGLKQTLQEIGKLRFDTIMVRRQFWICNLHRILRLKLRRDLTWYNQKVVTSHAVVASGITELFDHNMHQDPTKVYLY